MQREGRFGASQRDSLCFNKFVEEMELEDVPEVGRGFTWCKPNYKSKS